MKKNVERKEALMRLVVLVVSGVILWLWAYVAGVLAIVNWLVAIFADKRNKDVAEFIEYWSSSVYMTYRYLSGMTNKRPFPFSPLVKISKFEK
jgi:hypothetical protein